MFAVGRRVFYPCFGPCSIEGVSSRGAGAELFYHLVTRDAHGHAFVPVAKADALGLRPLVTRADVPRLLGRLERPAEPQTSWRDRTRAHLSLLASGSADELADVVVCLTALGRTRQLGYAEARMLERARAMLVEEISAVTRRTASAVRALVDVRLGRQLGERASEALQAH